MILALDQGTTSSRAIVFDDAGAVRAVAQKEFAQVFPQPGWVEHNPEDIWATQIAVAHEALARAGAHARDLKAIGITNQRETTVVWERATGRPVCNAIVWVNPPLSASAPRPGASLRIVPPASVIVMAEPTAPMSELVEVTVTPDPPVSMFVPGLPEMIVPTMSTVPTSWAFTDPSTLAGFGSLPSLGRSG